MQVKSRNSGGRDISGSCAYVGKNTAKYECFEFRGVNAMYVDGLWDVEGEEILCVEKLENEIYQIQYKDEKEVTILHAERYEKIINN